jgi:hypothetical protein
MYVTGVLMDDENPLPQPEAPSMTVDGGMMHWQSSKASRTKSRSANERPADAA